MIPNASNRSSRFVAATLALGGGALGLLPQDARAVSRVGNRNVTDATRTGVLEVPETHQRIEGLPGSERLRVSTIGIRPQSIDLTEFRAAYPELSDLSRDSLEARMSSQDWVYVPQGNACVDAFATQRNGTATWIVTWGGGHGFVFVGAQNRVNLAGLDHMIRTLNVEEQGCAWKTE